MQIFSQILINLMRFIYFLVFGLYIWFCVYELYKREDKTEFIKFQENNEVVV